MTSLEKKMNYISNFQIIELGSTIPRYLWAISQLGEDAAPQPNISRKLK